MEEKKKKKKKYLEKYKSRQAAKTTGDRITVENDLSLSLSLREGTPLRYVDKASNRGTDDYYDLSYKQNKK